MRLLLPMMHPAHVHLFKNVINQLENRGHEVHIVAIDKDITLELLDLYGLDYIIINQHDRNKIYNVFLNYVEIIYNLWKISKEIDPDIYLSRAVLPFSKKVLGIPHIGFFDSDIETLTRNFLSVDFIFSPSGYDKTIKNKLHLKLPTYKELAYLHPNSFDPNKSTLKKLDIDPNIKFTVLRFSGYEAWHDVGQYGIDHDTKVNLVKKLAEHGKVYISSEKELPNDLKKYELNIPYDKIHDVLYYADLFVGDSQTMTTEAAVLGTPAIRCNSFVGDDDMSNFIELEEKYDLIYNYRDPKKAIRKALELVQKPKLKENWHKKRDRLLEDKIDLSSFLTWFIDNYPESVDKLEKNKDIIWEVGQ